MIFVCFEVSVYVLLFVVGVSILVVLEVGFVGLVGFCLLRFVLVYCWYWCVRFACLFLCGVIVYVVVLFTFVICFVFWGFALFGLFYCD